MTELLLNDVTASPPPPPTHRKKNVKNNHYSQILIPVSKSVNRSQTWTVLTRMLIIFKSNKIARFLLN